MATSMSGSSGSGNEKRLTTPSSSTIKKTPRPLSSPSSPKNENTSSPTDSTKYVPNYLKPTISSSLDAKHPKKTSADTSVSNPTHARRRSLDRPPPATQVQRAAWGSPVGARDFKPQRSSSFSNKSAVSSSSTARPASEKIYARASSLKDGKVEPSLLKSRSLKKSTLSGSANKEPTATFRKRGPKSVTSESSVDYENRLSVDHLTFEEDLENFNAHEVQSLPKMSEMPDTNEELGDPNILEGEEPKESDLEDIHHDGEENLRVIDQVLKETEHAKTQPVIEESTHVKDAGELADKGARYQQDEGTANHLEQIIEKVLEVEPIDAIVEEEKEQVKKQIETEAKNEVVERIAATVEEQKAEVKEQIKTQAKIDEPINATVQEKKKEVNEQLKTEAKNEAVEPIDATVEDNKEEIKKQIETEAKKEEVKPAIVMDESQTASSPETIKTEAKNEEVKPVDATIQGDKEEVKEQIMTEAKKEEVKPAIAKEESQTVSSPAAVTATPTKTSQPSSVGKKDKQAYNDVIEQTTTKLMGAGSKKNKVLALAGAFETVISLHDTNKS